MRNMLEWGSRNAECGIKNMAKGMEPEEFGKPNAENKSGTVARSADRDVLTITRRVGHRADQSPSKPLAASIAYFGLKKS